MESLHGTFVNGVRVLKQKIEPGDVIRIGATELQLMAPGASMPSGTHTAVDAQVDEAFAAPEVVKLVGTMLHRFEVGRIVAIGRSGVVFCARDTKKDQTVALKVLWPAGASNQASKQRFRRAMETVIGLRHPNLVTVYNAGKTGGHHWISMEYVQGKSLDEMIRRIAVTKASAGKVKRALSPGLSRGWWLFALRVAVHVGRALEFAREHDIIHRDITPRNILIQEVDRIAKLGDLILAKPVNDENSVHGELLGDVQYMAPERTFDMAPMDARSDMYSLGAAIYALLTGRPPFVGQSISETVEMIRQAEPVRLRTWQPSIPEEFEELILRMLAKRREDRFKSPALLLAKLEQLASKEKLQI
jgi:serine/threonine-protein kinase